MSLHISKHQILHIKNLDFSQSRPKRPKFKVHRNEKIRPFFQSARQADSKNAKKFEKSSFFNQILPRKHQKSHATSQFFCCKKLPGCVHDYGQV